jgi:FKBP-type peptidyl-prolyl cis-trans isomerase FkpA
MTKLLTLSKLIVITSIFLSGAVTAQDSDTELKTEQEKLFYFIGSTFGDNLLTLRLSDEELALVVRGVREAAYGNAVKLDAPIYGPRMQQLAAERSSAWLEEERPKAEEYLKRMATEDGAQTTASGLIFLTLSAGSGKQPTEESIVKVNYHGTLRDGTVFDSSVERNNPIEVPLKMVMPCWKEGIAMIQTGGSAKITCPAELAYQDRGMGNIPPGAAVTFEIELINVND